MTRWNYTGTIKISSKRLSQSAAGEPDASGGGATFLEPVPFRESGAERFRPLLPPDLWQRFEAASHHASSLLSGRSFWHINSAARGGGVAEMLATLLPIARGAGIDARWLVVHADPAFFALTKRLHNLLHSGPEVAPVELEGERELYESQLLPAAAELETLVRPDDVVVVHDPQPAGLIPVARRLGCRVVWRSHIGTDEPGPAAKEAWRFLMPYVSQAEATVFSRSGYIWEGLDPSTTLVIMPAIDPFSPKNADLAPAAAEAIAEVIGLLAPATSARDGRRPLFRRSDGSEDTVRRPAEILQEERLPAGVPMVLQVSRWDRLKDPIGVMRGFIEHVPESLGAQLVLAGPALVGDDPEGVEVLSEVRELWRSWPEPARRRVHIVSLPLDDVDENAAVVNALQRRAAVVVQKSLREGFGLTVAEAMWKGRPVVASRRGGIQDQIEHGVSGWLLDDPADLKEYGALVQAALADPDLSARVGAAAHERVKRHFLAPRQLVQWDEVLERLLGQITAKVS
jgi:trehalose synthase